MPPQLLTDADSIHLSTSSSSPERQIFMFQLLLLFSLLSLHAFVHSDPPYPVCSNTTVPADNSQLQSYLKTLLLSLSSNASLSDFYNVTAGTGGYTLYGLGFCYEYVNGDKCKNCIDLASEDIQMHCPNQVEALLYEENCQLRYSDRPFLGRLDVTGNLPFDNIEDVPDADKPRFNSLVNETLQGLTKQAAFNSSSAMYAKTAVNFTDDEVIYAFVQCSMDLSPQNCSTCLEIAITNTSIASGGSRGARLYSPSCFLRYEFYPFYDDADQQNQTIPPESTNSSSKKNWVIASLAIGSAILVVPILGFVCSHRARTRGSQVSGEEDQVVEMGDQNNKNFLHDSLQPGDNLNAHNSPFIDLATLYAATHNFSDSNKLGQGGFGPVYKGTLPDGGEVAVKRLSACSEQGTDEFTNEVLFILKLQHKNLVRLVGFCVEGEEKLLIYEYMPNGSLDVFLLDPRKRAQLNWNRRRSIINGIARGMLYLHEDSRLRIIHRDLKPSNVLLDHHMNPKISDFGMARIFGGNDVEANTNKIVGTYGYMAPEFAMEGLYSDKSDVFSFGVLLLEIISGRKNIGFGLSRFTHSTVAHAWQMWNEGKGLEVMDPLMRDSCDPDEFLRYMHVGLLCVQEDAYDRPTMSSVAVMLKSETVTLSQPEKPAFFAGRFADACQLNENDYSVNELTVSEALPR